MGKVSTIASIVKKLLIKHPELKDNDKRLILNVWAYQEPELNENKYTVSFKMFSEMFKDGKLSSPESIRRSRQKLQEEFPELRGETYKVRQGKCQDEMKKDLHSPELLAGGTP